MNFCWFVASIAVPPICFSKKHHCTNGLYYFSLTESFYSPKNRFIKCTWFRVFCTCFLRWVCRLIKSERSDESPSLSARRLCKTCILNKSFCKERGGLESLKNSFENVLPNTLFFSLGITNIVFQLDVASRSFPPQDLLSHINVWMVSFLQSLLLLFHLCVFLSQLFELVWKPAEEISFQSASKCFQSFGPPANGNKSNAKKSRFCPNRNLTGTICHWSVILRSFSVVLNPAKRDANGFFKILLLSSHLLISGHPVQKSKFGACAVTGYCFAPQKELQWKII